MVNNYKYDEWGNILTENESIRNPFKYAGEIFDEESGLYYLRARYYDPAQGRFISEDSFEGKIADPLSLNLYTYCYNNPVMYVDNSGNGPTPLAIICGAVGTIVGWSFGDYVATSLGYTKANHPFKYWAVRVGVTVGGGVVGTIAGEALAPVLVGYLEFHPDIFNKLSGWVQNLVQNILGYTAANPTFQKLLEKAVEKDEVIIGAFQDGKIVKTVLVMTDKVYGHQDLLDVGQKGFTVLKDTAGNWFVTAS